MTDCVSGTRWRTSVTWCYQTMYNCLLSSAMTDCVNGTRWRTSVTWCCHTVYNCLLSSAMTDCVSGTRWRTSVTWCYHTVYNYLLSVVLWQTVSVGQDGERLSLDVIRLRSWHSWCVSWSRLAARLQSGRLVPCACFISLWFCGVVTYHQRNFCFVVQCDRFILF